LVSRCFVNLSLRKWFGQKVRIRWNKVASFLAND
jgi:hypothetical protein